MKPYNNREAADDALSRLFNSRLSAIRTRMSENVFARWKGMFPILRMLRAHYHHAKIIIVATAILHKIAIKFGEVEPEEDEEVLGLLRAVVTQMDEPVVEADRDTAFLIIFFFKYISFPMKMVFSPSLYTYLF